MNSFLALHLGPSDNVALKLKCGQKPHYCYITLNHCELTFNSTNNELLSLHKNFKQKSLISAHWCIVSFGHVVKQYDEVLPLKGKACTMKKPECR